MKTTIKLIATIILLIATIWMMGQAYRVTREMKNCKKYHETGCHKEWDGFPQGFNVYWKEG